MHNELARLVAYSFHAPKKIPDYRPVRQRATRQVSDLSRVHAFFSGLAMRNSG